jgi:hypothetical protein
MDLLNTVSQTPARLIGWLRADDYEQAKHRATTQVIARLGRGNVAVQNGFVLDDEELERRRVDGSAAIDRLARTFARIEDR